MWPKKKKKKKRKKEYIYILGKVESHQLWPRLGSLRPSLSFEHIDQSAKEAWFRQENVLECSGFLSLMLEVNRWAEFKWKRAVILTVIRSRQEYEPSWEVLEASEVSTEYWNCLPGRAAEEKQWWGGIPEDCFTEGPSSIHVESVNDWLSSQSLFPEWPGVSGADGLGLLRAPGIRSFDTEQLVFVMPCAVRCLHRLELEICLSFRATLWRRQPFNHLCLRNKPLSGVHHTCFHATHVCSDLATSIWE